MPNLLRIVRDLRGGGRRFSELLCEHIDVTRAAATLLEEAVRGDRSWESCSDALQPLLAAGERLRGELLHGLSYAVTTPLDREDLFRLSRSIGTVLDNLRDLQRETELFAPTRPELLAPLIGSVTEALRRLHTAVLALTGPRGSVARRTEEAKHAVIDVRRKYDDALAELFRGPLEMDTLKHRELLRRLDVVGLRLDEATNALADAVIKRGES